MKLKDVQSKELLPSWAVNAEWLQNGLDLAVRSISARIPGMGAPFTLDAVKALSDEELEALYEQIGIVKYYPDLSRSTRENFIFEIYTNARYLGTPAVVEKLIKYIFDGQPVNVTIHDNLAFDSSGSLVDRSLLDTYDIELNIPVANLPALVLSRLYENLYNLVRNTQKLRAVEFTFDDENIDCNTYFGIIPAETPGIVVDLENDAVCDMPPAPAYFTAYFTNAGASATGDITLQNSTTYRLYDASGNLISLDNTKIYKYAGSYVYNGDPTYIPPGYEDNPAALWYFPYSTRLTYLNLRVNGNKDAFRFEYTEIQTLTAWFSPDQSSVGFNANETKVLYDDNGEKITYNDSVTYTIYLWRTSSEWTNRYVNYYKLVNLNGFLACMNTNNISYAGFRGLRFYSQPAEIS